MKLQCGGQPNKYTTKCAAAMQAKPIHEFFLHGVFFVETVTETCDADLEQL